MKPLEKIKKLRNETGMPFALIKNILKEGEDYDIVKSRLLAKKNADIDVIIKKLVISGQEAEAKYYEYNCCVERCLLQERKKSLPLSTEQKKKSISNRLEKGALLVGELRDSIDDYYRWITVKKASKNSYTIAIVSMEKSDVDNCLDLIYSDAKEYLEVNKENILEVFIYLESYLNIMEFDVLSAYESYPL